MPSSRLVFSLDPILSATGLQSPVLTAPVRGSTPTLFSRLSAVQRQLLSSGSPVNCPPAPLSSQLSFASPYHFRIRRDFRSKNPLSGFAPKQTKESPALAGNPYSATGRRSDKDTDSRQSSRFLAFREGQYIAKSENTHKPSFLSHKRIPLIKHLFNFLFSPYSFLVESYRTNAF